jgi:hypothetical protein
VLGPKSQFGMTWKRKITAPIGDLTLVVQPVTSYSTFYPKKQALLYPFQANLNINILDLLGQMW